MTCAGKVLRVRNRGLNLPKEGRDKMSPFLSLFLFQRRENLEKYEDFIVVPSVSQKLLRLTNTLCPADCMFNQEMSKLSCSQTFLLYFFVLVHTVEYMNSSSSLLKSLNRREIGEKSWS